MTAPPPVVTHDLLAGHLDGYRYLLDSWQEALRLGAAEPASVALAALVRRVDEMRMRELREMCSPGPWFELLIGLPLPAPGLFPTPAIPPGWLAAGLDLWEALLVYRQHRDAFCALYQGLGARTLAQLEQALAGASRVNSVADLYAHWLRCQDAGEVAIVRAESYAGRLARMITAAARLRVAHRQYVEQVLGVGGDSSAQRALSEEIAAIRRQLRTLARTPARRT